MMSALKKYPLIICISLLLNTFIFSATNAAETLPDDVRYMLEDLYGADIKQWPSPRYSRDLNNDGFADWVAKKKGCNHTANCPAEIFICLPDKTGTCVEYCYIEVKTLINIEKNLPKMKCESTC